MGRERSAEVDKMLRELIVVARHDEDEEFELHCVLEERGLATSSWGPRNMPGIRQQEGGWEAADTPTPRAGN